MPEVGIGFKLHGDATEFERAINSAKEKTHELHTEVRGLNQTMRLLKEGALGFGLVEAFNKALEKAKQLREEAERTGKAVDMGVASMARFADVFDRTKESASTGFVKLFGGIMHGWELVGDALRGNNPLTLDDEEDNAGKSGKAANFQDAQKDSRKRIEEIRKKGAEELLSTQGKINQLVKENYTLSEKISAISETDTSRNALHEQYEKNVVEMKKLALELTKKQGEEQKRAAEEQERDGARIFKLLTDEDRERGNLLNRQSEIQDKINGMQDDAAEAQKDRGRLSLSELANAPKFAAGLSSDVSNNSDTARNILNLEKQANERRLSGDQTGFSDLTNQALDMRHSLGGIIHNGEANPEEKLGPKLDALHIELQTITQTLGGYVKNGTVLSR